MKKLLLLSAFLIFACSSDDSNDNNDDSNQTFLERYDGVVWVNDLYDPISNDSDPLDTVYYIFYDQTVFLDAGWYDSELECASMDPEWSTFFASLTILENLNNNMTIQDSDGETINFSVSNDGQTLTETLSGQGSQTYSRSDISNPCE